MLHWLCSKGVSRIQIPMPEILTIEIFQFHLVILNVQSGAWIFGLNNFGLILLVG
ncbi:hypothetical protein BD410DRAFT_1922 [Rickenella mellea]|uniref:Uncharacterized protein n=1 Tax=Rickenella mellea TaxID=50990 RepID=A0A4R5XER0_9AGAM|nr:hypothetical protein BD410DRAFT_1922 [Rickenella mellea]